MSRLIMMAAMGCWMSQPGLCVDEPGLMVSGESQSEAFLGALDDYAAGNFAEAFESLSELFKADPLNEQLNFSLGMASFAYGKLSHAVLAFERVISMNPGHERARLELARSYASMGQHELAEEYFRQVSKTSPPLAVQQNIERYLREIELVKRSWRVEMRAGTGVFYDDNVNIGPDSRLVRIQPTIFDLATFDQLVVAEDSRPKDDIGVFALALVHADVDPGFREEWGLFAGGSYYQSWLSSEHNFEVSFLRGYAGVGHTGRRHLLEARVKGEHLWQGHEDLVSVVGLDPLLIYSLSSADQLETRAELEYRTYHDQSTLDGYYLELTQGAAHRFADSPVRVSMRLGGFLTEADADIYDHIGALGEAMALSQLPWKTDLRVHAQARFSWYDEREVLAREDREDRELIVGIALHRPFGGGWSSTLSYQHTTNTSTFDLYEYSRNVLSLSMDRAL